VGFPNGAAGKTWYFELAESYCHVLWGLFTCTLYLIKKIPKKHRIHLPHDLHNPRRVGHLDAWIYIN
jgi:hypothetical protein